MEAQIAAHEAKIQAEQAKPDPDERNGTLPIALGEGDLRLAGADSQAPWEESPQRDELETEFFGSLAHLKEHAASLSEWVDRLIEALPEEG